MKINRTKCFFILTMVAAMFFASNAMAKKPIELRFVTPVPQTMEPHHTWHSMMENNFNERAGGEYVIKTYYGGALAKLPEYFDAVRFGTVDLAASAWGMFSNKDQRLGAFDTPFLINSWQAGIYAAEKSLPIYDQILQKKFNAKGLVLLTTGGFHILGSKPIKTLEDFKGTMFGAVNPNAAALVKDLGGAPVTIMWTDLFESLQKGVVEATTQQYRGMIVTNTLDVCKYVTSSYVFPAMLGISINLDVWKKMPASIQKALVEVCVEGANYMHDALREQEKQDLKTIPEKGGIIYKLPIQERERWVKATEASTKAKFDKFGDFGVEIMKILKEADTKYPYQEN